MTWVEQFDYARRKVFTNIKKLDIGTSPIEGINNLLMLSEQMAKQLDNQAGLVNAIENHVEHMIDKKLEYVKKED